MYIDHPVKQQLFLFDLMTFEFPQHVFEKYPAIKFYENPSSGKRVVPFGRADRHDDANSRFSQFCERV